MSDLPENLVLAQLPEIRGIVLETRADVRDLKTRVTALEGQVGQLHLSFAGQSGRLDRIEARLDRIERRLDLVDAAPK